MGIIFVLVSHDFPGEMRVASGREPLAFSLSLFLCYSAARAGQIAISLHGPCCRRNIRAVPGREPRVGECFKGLGCFPRQ